MAEPTKFDNLVEMMEDYPPSRHTELALHNMLLMALKANYRQLRNSLEDDVDDVTHYTRNFRI